MEATETTIQDLEVAHAQSCDRPEPHPCWDCPDFAPMDEAGDAVMEQARQLATVGPINVSRAERGAMAMQSFFGHSEGSLADMLTDLYAYAQREGTNFNNAAAIARNRFNNSKPDPTRYAS